jgi:lantibiotic modifying enzyme
VCDLATIAGKVTDLHEDPYLAVARQAAERLAASPPDTGRSLCHGAAGTWEFLAAAAQVLPDSATPGREQLDASLILALEQQARTATQIAEASAPGLLNGLAGTVLTVLRMHPEHELPSPLLLGG